METKRVVWLDLVRVLAIYLVLLVHSLGAAGDSLLNFPRISVPLSAVCVPLFVMLSGALLLNKNESYSVFFKKRFLRLMLPWLTWTFIYILFKLWQKPLTNLGQLPSLFSLTFTSFWFLPMILGLYLLTPALRIFIKNSRPREILFPIGLWFFAISVLPYYRNSLAFPFYVDDGIVRQVFTYLGYFLFGAYLIKIKLPKLEYLLFLLFLGLSLSFANFYLGVANGWHDPYFSFNYIFPGTVLSTVSIFAIIKSFENNLSSLNGFLRPLIASLSGASFGIFFVHGMIADLFTKFLGRPFLFKVEFLSEWVNSLTLFILSYLIILVLTRFRILKRFIT